MKKKIFFNLFVILFVTFNSIGQTFNEKTLEERTRPYGDADKPGISWKIRWDRSDLFNNDNFPDSDFKYDTRRWTKTPENVQSWVWRNKQNIEQRDGSLYITARYNESGFPENRVPSACVNGSPSSTLVPVRFSSGMLRSSTPGFVYGYYEAAIKGSAGFPGVSPAFWLYNSIKSNQTVGKVRYSEIDIVELTQEGTSEAKRKVMDHNLHAITSASTRHKFDSSLNRPVGAFVPAVNQNGGLSLGPISSTAGRRWWRPKQNTAAQRNETHEFEPRDINIFGCLVTSQEIVWYVNGKEIGRKPNVLWQKESDLSNPMRITLSLGIRAPYNQFCSNRFVMPNPSVLERAKDFFPQTMQVLYVKVFELTSDSSPIVSVNNVVIEQSEVPLRVGGNTILTPVILPKEASNKNFTFYSVSGMDVARIDSKTGIVTALKKGSATFRVITEDGNFFDDITVTVSENPGQTRNINIPVPPGSAGLVPSGPDNPGNSNCENIPVWKKSDVYVIGDKVKLEGKLYELKSSKGKCRPGVNSQCSINQWKEIGSCELQNKEALQIPDNEIEIGVYPNPTMNMVNIISKKGSIISILSPSGKVVFKEVSKGEISSFDTHGLSRGLYLVTIQNKNEVITKKLIIK
ncbi:T9SS type A sorting domain-containing protein [Flavivirga abyssicola]|uniref:T9SS type A sorting domain-containing protein n=1 Tax=Flavivirga abyssicola TaxID=3063533 RepID=UPI0026E0DB58|nr:T9SS type A sorting domain-containing protein [Flavivirga sp. MEBiC07777]WVK12666.1 T9SS type A sorting domain-containing protein [Flavivirga sp. MEBiC07777]